MSATRNEAQQKGSKPTASMTYRGPDGRPHIVPAQEEAARAAERNDADPKPDLSGLASRTPD